MVATALGFDFTNGFHDTGNAMATSIATGALRPRVAVGVSAVLNLAGAFLSTAVAATIASGLVAAHEVTLSVVCAGLTGSILWNLATWFLGIPSSSSHALVGGVIGATAASVGAAAVKWQDLVSKVVVPAALSPFIAGGVAVVGTLLVYRITRRVPERARRHGFRLGQIGSASMVSLAHGTNDAQKTMGVITLALIADGALPAGAKAPDWVIVSCALAIGLGSYAGGWRVIRTLGKGLTEIEPTQGMASESATAAVILCSTDFGYPLSTTHVATGTIVGSGVGRTGAEVHWRIARRLVTAWLLTLPASALLGAVAFWTANGIGGTAGVAVVFVVLVLLSTVFFAASRRRAVTPENVNAAWTGSVLPTPPSESSSDKAAP
ncbi:MULTISPECIES: inorganic phosphate transporter [unclassified Streptomyces]|uniref:inorganic phosphate transporter n=1 Tax=unclassified Streptomyces TaxID=2593676 RepID=UPI001661840E|nr:MULTISPECIES: inorganic phosphate transporter [unclassified Streptomyces]MBD0711528.1 phosphate transporter [Streptomyces sp. CBMA291]MBD0716532.1 phosphate transporter [Streptomyces sp. CBMA370]